MSRAAQNLIVKGVDFDLKMVLLECHKEEKTLNAFIWKYIISVDPPFSNSLYIQEM